MRDKSSEFWEKPLGQARNVKILATTTAAAGARNSFRSCGMPLIAAAE
jgi:hypothetical protein